MCADCHTTRYQKNFDPQQQRHSSTWSEIGVGCEACHGPGSEHSALAAGGQLAKSAGKGLSVRLERPDHTLWLWDEVTGKPRRSQANHQADSEIKVCAHCHALRTQIAEGFVPGKALLDFYRPDLPQPPPFLTMASKRRRFGPPGGRDFPGLDAWVAVGASPSGLSAALMQFDTQPSTPLTRTTAFARIAMQQPDIATPFIDKALRSPDDVARLSAVELAINLPTEVRIPPLLPLLGDPRLSVRLAAVGRLLELSDPGLTTEQAQVLSPVISEYRRSQMLNADRAEAQTNLGQLEVRLNNPDRAFLAFEAARKRNPRFIPAYLAQAQLYAGQGKVRESNQVLAAH